MLTKRLTRWAVGAAAAFAIALAPNAHAEKVLRIVPHADLKNLDPIWTTAYITRNHGYMVYDTLFAVDQNWNSNPRWWIPGRLATMAWCIRSPCAMA